MTKKETIRNEERLHDESLLLVLAPTPYKMVEVNEMDLNFREAKHDDICPQLDNSSAS